MEKQYEFVGVIEDDIGTVNIYRAAITDDERKQRLDRFHKRLAELLMEDAQRAAINSAK